MPNYTNKINLQKDLYDALVSRKDKVGRDGVIRVHFDRTDLTREALLELKQIEGVKVKRYGPKKGRKSLKLIVPKGAIEAVSEYLEKQLEFSKDFEDLENLLAEDNLPGLDSSEDLQSIKNISEDLNSENSYTFEDLEDLLNSKESSKPDSSKILQPFNPKSEEDSNKEVLYFLAQDYLGAAGYQPIPGYAAKKNELPSFAYTTLIRPEKGSSLNSNGETSDGKTLYFLNKATDKGEGSYTKLASFPTKKAAENAREVLETMAREEGTRKNNSPQNQPFLNVRLVEKAQDLQRDSQSRNNSGKHTNFFTNLVKRQRANTTPTPVLS